MHEMLMIVFLISALFCGAISGQQWDECGTTKKSNKTNFIVGGSQTNLRDWPWLSAIYEIGPYYDRNFTIKFICGGSIVTSKLIVTAAHCIEDHRNNPLKYLVYVGRQYLDLWGRGDKSQAKQIKKIVMHEEYSYSDAYDGDLAILVLKYKIEFNRQVQRVCLLLKHHTHASRQEGTVVGWGRTDDKYMSNMLMLANLTVITREECIASDEGFESLLSSNSFCAGSDKDGVGPCQGDTGGGFYSQVTEGDVTRWTLRGVISHGLRVEGRDDCLDQKYFVFTDMSKYIPWVRDMIERENELLYTESSVTIHNETSEELSKICSRLKQNAVQITEELAKQYKSKDLDLALSRYHVTSIQELKHQSEEQRDGLVKVLQMLRQTRENAKLSKGVALRISQRISLPQHLREPVRYGNGNIAAPGSVEYISGLEIEHGNNALGWMEHHISLKAVTYLVQNGADVRATGGKFTRTILHEAAWQGVLDVVVYAVQHNADVNVADTFGETALHRAALNGHIDVVKQLISQGVDVNVTDRGGETALHFAALRGHIDVVKYLISQGADVNVADNRGWTTLHDAALEGHIDVVKHLISQGADVNARYKYGWTALHNAAWSSNVDVIRHLVTSGAELNIKDGRTALHNAALSGHIEVVKYLISQGVDVNVTDKDGETALHRAASSGHIDIVKYLISMGADVNVTDNNGLTALHRAARSGHIDIVKYLISQGVDVNVTDKDGRTALHHAALSGHIDIVKYLISQGADVNVTDNDGETALHKAALWGYIEVVKYLISQGADVNVTSNDGETALHEAAWSGHIDIVKYLISQGVDVNVTDNDGRTALHRAALSGHIDIVKYLIFQGVDVNVTDNNGLTALHCAAWSGHIDVVKYLISQSADVNVTDKDGETALHEAAWIGHLDVVRHLVTSGADHKIKNNKGQTALDWAREYNKPAVVEYMQSLQT